MKKVFIVVALVAFAGLSMGADSCGTSSTKDQADTSGNDSGASSTPQKKPKPHKARIGDSITVEGSDNTMKVTVLRVEDPVQAGEFDQPDKGKRFVGVFVKLRNVGEKSYSDSPSNGSALITNANQKADTTIMTSGDCSSDFASDAKIAPGESLEGCIPFEVTEGQRPKTFQFALDSGFANQNAEWRLK